MIYFLPLIIFPPEPSEPPARPRRHLPTDQDLWNFHHGSGQMWTGVGHPELGSGFAMEKDENRMIFETDNNIE